MEVPFTRVQPDAVTPSYAHEGDAGADLYAVADAVVAARGGRTLVPTGIAIALPEGTAGFVVPRSGLALRHGVTLLNTPGLIDAGYRGELKVLLVNTDPNEDYAVQRGDRIAQLVVVAIAPVRFVPTESLPQSARAEGGFGHTGR